LHAEGMEESVNCTEPCSLVGDFFCNRCMASLGKVKVTEDFILFRDPARGEDVVIVTRGKNAVFNRVLKLPQSHKTTNWCAA